MNDREVAGVRRAIDWLHKRAGTMTDPHAKAVLNSAATNLGWALRDWQEPDCSTMAEDASFTLSESHISAMKSNR